MTSKLQGTRKILLLVAHFLTPLAVCVAFPEFTFFVSSIAVGLFPLGVIGAVPLLIVYFVFLQKAPFSQQAPYFLALLGFFVGCCIVIIPKYEYFELLIRSTRH